MDALLQYQWPGNVRELQNVIERAVSLSTGEAILPHDLPESLLGTAGDRVALAGADSFAESKQNHIESFEMSFLEQLLQRHGGNVSKAARQAGISRRTIHRLIQKYNLDPEKFRHG
jgi:DNA-binding NtrC family response regulator